jgi:hypothetical protein
MTQQNPIVSVKIPLALEQLILANNTLLKNYQAELMYQVQQASEQMLHLLGLNPEHGWKLDISSMCYVRERTEEELAHDNISDPEYGTIA